MAYTKLFGSIIHSTIWRAPDHVRLVWVTMLAMADQDGVVEASVPGLADAARVSLGQCEEALKALHAPDAYSRTRDHEGRRIETVEGGWLLLNHGAYRDKMSLDDRREKAAARQRKRRARLAKENAAVTPDVTRCHASSPPVEDVTTYSASASSSVLSEDGVQGEPKPDRFMASFAPKSTKREDVQRVHRAWIKAFRLPHNTPLVRGYSTDDADTIAAAVDTYGEADCVTMLRYAPNDGMVSGRSDERGLKHESIRYLFGDNLPRLMRDALAAKERRTGAGSAEAIERRKAAQ